ncbi:DUF1697 domain-containing protein [Psychroserpens sp. AS72]|uniref:DUF1697 domain-containing protein n=1 Tax=Psychroserpens sp. AS72 TaxID=3135775 RepID=UPI0031795DED
MIKFIILIRGINVGGHKKVQMSELRELLAKVGFQDVKTYIQSGNIILNASEENSKVESKVKQTIQSHFGFDVPVIAKTRAELKRIFDACPFSEEKKENSYFVMLSDIPEAELIDEVKTITYVNEEYQILNDCIYFYSSIGYGNSKFNMNVFEKKLNVKATSRNYKTMVKLLSLSFD